MVHSPAPSHGGEIVQHGLRHLMQHNANNSYPHHQYEHGPRLQARSAFTTPGPDFNGQQRYGYEDQQHELGSGMKYEGGYKNEYQGQAYRDHYSTPATSPPTPQPEALKTRSGLVINKGSMRLRSMSEERSHVEKPSQKSKKVKKEKIKAERKGKPMSQPLSVLTKDWKHSPIVDIEAYVNRSAEERRREVEEGKFPGKVKRPMNSFMLYRKAYQNRTKEWCLENNHQVVSQVCGDSWPLEPEEVREQFSEWARIERTNHQNAHPGYKFSPSKPGASKAVKRKVSEEPMSDEESDLDDYDWQRGQRQKKIRFTPKIERHDEQPVAYPTTKSAYAYSRETSIEPGGYRNSSWENNNAGRLMPAQYNVSSLRPGQYYHQQIMPSQHIQGSEDVIIRKSEDSNGQGYVGHPEGHAYVPMLAHPYAQHQGHQNYEPEIDPALMSHEQGAYNAAQYGHPQGQGVYLGDVHTADQYWNVAHGTIEPIGADASRQYLGGGEDVDNLGMQCSQMHVLKSENGNWPLVSLGAESKFQGWVAKEQ